ncbi:MAG: DUF3054 domain-containing protein [Anaerolineales bacterium]|nr:DUF3054 domain-containing protein [Anaerolineales bacterium]
MRDEKRTLLILGDVITLVLVTLFGFASHGELESAGWRMLTTLLPMALAWFAVAPVAGAYQEEGLKSLRQLWRPLYAMLLAGPLAAILRGVWLNRPVIPAFALVLAAVGGAAILAWRLLYYWAIARKSKVDG